LSNDLDKVRIRFTGGSRHPASADRRACVARVTAPRRRRLAVRTMRPGIDRQVITELQATPLFGDAVPTTTAAQARQGIPRSGDSVTRLWRSPKRGASSLYGGRRDNALVHRSSWGRDAYGACPRTDREHPPQLALGARQRVCSAPGSAGAARRKPRGLLLECT